jgi:hypothetical protein
MNKTTEYPIYNKGFHTVCTRDAANYLQCGYEIIGTKHIENRNAFAHLQVVGKAVELLQTCQGVWIIYRTFFFKKSEPQPENKVFVCQENLKEVLDIVYQNSAIIKSNKKLGRRAAENAILKQIA